MSMPKKKRIRMKNLAAPIVVLVILVGLLEFIARAFHVNEHILPPPSAWLLDTAMVFEDIAPHLLFTIKIIVLGFLISVPLGMLIAAVLSQSKLLTAAFSPLILCLVITPMITLIPIMLLWLGTNPDLRLLVIIVQATPIITFNTLNGFCNVEAEKLQLGVSVGATKLQTFLKVTFMNAMPQVFTGIKLGCIFSTIGAISADFVGGIKGMGTRIQFYTGMNATAVSYGCILMVALVGLILYYIVEAVEHRVIIWKK